MRDTQYGERPVGLSVRDPFCRRTYRGSIRLWVRAECALFFCCEYTSSYIAASAPCVSIKREADRFPASFASIKRKTSSNVMS